MRPPLKNISSNDFQTPKEALYPLFPYLRKEWAIWECASGDGNLVEEFKNRGFRVIGTDVKQGFDFLKYEPLNYDCIITNPPYSIKQKFLERAYNLNKPFAFLLPLTTLETEKRQKLFEEYGVEIIFLNKRINFKTPSGKGSGSWFATAWFTHGLNIGKQINFAKI